MYRNTVKKYRNISQYGFPISWHPYNIAAIALLHKVQSFMKRSDSM